MVLAMGNLLDYPRMVPAGPQSWHVPTLTGANDSCACGTTMNPVEMRQEARKLDARAEWHEQQATGLREQAMGLRELAESDELRPPTEDERIRRILGAM